MRGEGQRAQPGRTHSSVMGKRLLTMSRLYFAGPLFTTHERKFIDECAAKLKVEGFKVFVPHEGLQKIDAAERKAFREPG